MIHLKNGYEIPYHRDFDQFFKALLTALITESRLAAKRDIPGDSPNDRFLRELMDNCIYVTHQLFEIARNNEEFSRFMVTGFLFNSIILSLSQNESDPPAAGGEDAGKSVVH